jgi:hypothetical protein
VKSTLELESANHTTPDSCTEASSVVSELWPAIDKFSAWLDASGYATYDPYDIWGTRYGKWARRLYYRKHPLGTVMTAPVVLMEIAFPGLRGLFVRKDRYPTADAQLALAFLNLYQITQPRQGNRLDTDGGLRSQACLVKARSLADELLTQSVPGYRGFCWGYPFDWQHANGLMPKQTPHITATPYAYEVFTRLFDLTGEDRYHQVASSIAEFVFEDLNDTPTGTDSAASSYTPQDHSKIVNASAYRAFVLFDSSERSQNEEFRSKAWKNLRFILESQRDDGSWLYAVEDPAQAFIDHFHTCFVLKNLYKLNRHLLSGEVEQAVRRGYRWYRKALFDGQDNPKSFAISPRLGIVRLEMYDWAEAISLGALLKSDIPSAFVLAEKLATQLIRCYQLPSGHWLTRVYRGGIRHTTPFLRWPQSQLFLALTNLLLAAQNPASSC